MSRVLAFARGLGLQVYGRTVPLVRQAVRPAHADGAPAARQDTGKRISSMAQLKNCCLGGDRDRQDKERNNEFIAVLSYPRSPLFLLLTNKVYL